MTQIILALQHTQRLIDIIREHYHFVDLRQQADQLQVRVEKAAESAIALHEELKELREYKTAMETQYEP